MKKIILFALLGFFGTSIHAQSDWIWNQYQYFGQTDTAGSAGLWGDIQYEVTSNRLSNGLMNEAIFQGKISSSTTAGVEDFDPDKYLRVYGSTNGSLWFRSKRKNNWRWMAGAGYQEQFIGNMKSGLAQLYLKGNGPFEDQQMSLGPSQITFYSYQFVGGGIERHGNTTSWGVTAQLLKTSRYYSLLVGNSSLYTATNGTSIEADVNMSYTASASKQPKLSAWYGTGFSLNGYFTYQESPDDPLFCVQVQDLGNVFFEGVESLTLTDSLIFEGVEVNSILELDDSLIGNGDVDSLEALLGMERTHPSATALLPAHVRIHYIRQLGEKWRLALRLKQFITFGIPEVRVGLTYQPKPWLALEPSIRAGGMSRFDVGLSAAIQAGESLQIIVKSEQFENLIAPQESTGQYLFVGGQLVF